MKHTDGIPNDQLAEILLKVLYGETAYCITCHQPSHDADSKFLTQVADDIDDIDEELDAFDDRILLLELTCSMLVEEVDRLTRQNPRTTSPGRVFGENQPEPRVFNPHFVHTSACRKDTDHKGDCGPGFCDEEKCCGGSLCCE
jgi:hypothetical protein